MGRKDHFRKDIRPRFKLEVVIQEQEYRKQLCRQIGGVYSVNAIAEKYIEYVKNHQSRLTYRNKFRMLNVAILPFFGGMMPDYIAPVYYQNLKRSVLDR